MAYSVWFKNADDYIRACDALTEDRIRFIGGDGLSLSVAKTDWDDAENVLMRCGVQYREN